MNADGRMLCWGINHGGHGGDGSDDGGRRSEIGDQRTEVRGRGDECGSCFAACGLAGKVLGLCCGQTEKNFLSDHIITPAAFIPGTSIISVH